MSTYFFSFFSFRFACTSSGSLFIINFKNLSILAVHRLSTTNESSHKEQPRDSAEAALTCISVNEAFCAIGCNDGFVRLWPLEFDQPFMEAGKLVQVTSLGTFLTTEIESNQIIVSKCPILSELVLFLTVSYISSFRYHNFYLCKLREHLFISYSQLMTFTTGRFCSPNCTKKSRSNVTSGCSPLGSSPKLSSIRKLWKPILKLLFPVLVTERYKRLPVRYKSLPLMSSLIVSRLSDLLYLIISLANVFFLRARRTSDSCGSLTQWYPCGSNN